MVAIQTLYFVLSKMEILYPFFLPSIAFVAYVHNYGLLFITSPFFWIIFQMDGLMNALFADFRTPGYDL
jgi:hypothetical protein